MPESTYQRAAGALDAVVDGQVVLLSPADMSYHSLDRVGARVWAQVAQPATTDEIVAALRSEYVVDEDRCRADLQPFLDRMVAIGILEAG